jgi:hypothetical protein
MKKAVYVLIVFGLVAALFSAFIPLGYAQEPEPTPEPVVIATDENVVLFSDLGFVDETLYGPFDTQRYRYFLPDTWELQPGAEIQLVINTFIGGVGVPPEGMLRLVGGSLEVAFNKVTIETILLDAEGERTITIPIPDEALTPARADGRHELRLTLDSGLYLLACKPACLCEMSLDLCCLMKWVLLPWISPDCPDRFSSRHLSRITR